MKLRHLALATLATAMAAGTALAQTPDPTTTPATTPTETTPTTQASAPADAAGAFGHVGQLVITTALDESDISLNTDLSFVHRSQSMGGSSTNMFTLSPTAHYFVVPNVSVSGGLIIQHGTTSVDTGIGSVSVDGTAIGLIVGAGYNLHLAPALSLWPNLNIGYIHVSASAAGMDASGYIIPLQVIVPLLYHPAEHFFLGLGGVLRTELASKMESMDQAKRTDLGLTALLGGYFNL